MLRDIASHVYMNIWKSFDGMEIMFMSDQTPKILSPKDVLDNKYGSCTAMSIFLCNALRSVGVPARVVGVAEWNRADGGNHNWVEAFFDGQWNFIDAVPPSGRTEAEWNKAWFTQSGLVQKSLPGTMSAVTTPVWDEQKAGLADTNYNVTWDIQDRVKKEDSEDKDKDGEFLFTKMNKDDTDGDFVKTDNEDEEQAKEERPKKKLPKEPKSFTRHKKAGEADDLKVYLKVPAVDRTLYYQGRPDNGQDTTYEVRSGSTLMFSLSVLPVLAAMLAL
jgi:hypothetical protein